MTRSHNLPIIEHTRFLEELTEIPAYLHPEHESGLSTEGYFSCGFCGVGDQATILTHHQVTSSRDAGFESTMGLLTLERFGQILHYPTQLKEEGILEVEIKEPIAQHQSVLHGLFEVDEEIYSIIAKESGLSNVEGKTVQKFTIYASTTHIAETHISNKMPTQGCNKLKLSMGEHRAAYPIHMAPSVLDVTGRRVALYYEEALERLADLILNHTQENSRILVYASGQLDYFAVFALQEVFRLLGVRNLSSNTEFSLSTLGKIAEMQTGQESPTVNLEQALTTPNSFYLLCGWNGLISHPPVYQALINREDLDAYLIETVVTESSKMLAAKLGSERVLLIKPGSDSLLALSVAHVLLKQFPNAVEQRFIEQFSNRETYHEFCKLAGSEQYAPATIAPLISANEDYTERLVKGIADIASKLAQAENVPIVIPSVGLTQSKGVVPLGLWSNILALLGKYGLKAPKELAGGFLRLPGQTNGQTMIQGFSSEHFMGRIPMNEEGIKDAALRMDLPDETAYLSLLGQEPIAVVDYGKERDGKELILCFGTQPEKKMVHTSQWVKKIQAPTTTLVAVDPIPSPFTLDEAALVIPSPPHAATSKLYQNGEWRLHLSFPRRSTPEQTRTDATIIYDLMALISQRLRNDEELLEQHSQFKPLVESAYLQKRFEAPETGGELQRVQGEVSRPQLWNRIQSYMDAGKDRLGKLYCKPEYADGQPIPWQDLVTKGFCLYGGVGETRSVLNYEQAESSPFQDIYGQPTRFQFFLPQDEDLKLPEGIILNTGRTTLSDQLKAIRFALSTFNSGKSTPTVNMPEENQLFLSLSLAEQLGLQAGEPVAVSNSETRQEQVFSAQPTARVKGSSVYMSCHPSQAEFTNQHQLNHLISTQTCPYSGQSTLKLTSVEIRPIRQE